MQADPISQAKPKSDARPAGTLDVEKTLVAMPMVRLSPVPTLLPRRPKVRGKKLTNERARRSNRLPVPFENKSPPATRQINEIARHLRPRRGANAAPIATVAVAASVRPGTPVEETERTAIPRSLHPRKLRRTTKDRSLPNHQVTRQRRRAVQNLSLLTPAPIPQSVPPKTTRNHRANPEMGIA